MPCGPTPLASPPSPYRGDIPAGAAHRGRRVSGAAPCFVHRPVLVDLVVELFAPVPAGRRGRRHPRRRRPRRGAPRRPPAPLGPRPRPGPRRHRRRQARLAPLRRPGAPCVHARFDQLAEVAEPLAGLGHAAPAARCSTSASARPSSTGPSGASATAAPPRSTCAWTRPGRSAPPTSSTATDEAELARAAAPRYGDERYARAHRPGHRRRTARRHHRRAGRASCATPSPPPARRRGGHPARRTFQAIRIEVNDELDILPGALDAALDALRARAAAGRIAYHSGEDRIVKARFRHAETGGCTCPPTCRAPCGACARRSACCAAAPGRPSATRSPPTPAPRRPASVPSRSSTPGGGLMATPASRHPRRPQPRARTRGPRRRPAAGRRVTGRGSASRLSPRAGVVARRCVAVRRAVRRGGLPRAAHPEPGRGRRARRAGRRRSRPATRSCASRWPSSSRPERIMDGPPSSLGMVPAGRDRRG